MRQRQQYQRVLLRFEKHRIFSSGRLYPASSCQRLSTRCRKPVEVASCVVKRLMKSRDRARLQRECKICLPLFQVSVVSHVSQDMLIDLLGHDTGKGAGLRSTRAPGGRLLKVSPALPSENLLKIFSHKYCSLAHSFTRELYVVRVAQCITKWASHPYPRRVSGGRSSSAFPCCKWSKTNKPPRPTNSSWRGPATRVTPIASCNNFSDERPELVYDALDTNVERLLVLETNVDDLSPQGWPTPWRIISAGASRAGVHLY